MKTTETLRGDKERLAKYRTLAFFCVKILLAIGLFLWLYERRYLDFDRLRKIEWGPQDILLVTIGLLAVFIGQILLACRLRALLANASIRVSLGRMVRLTLAGSFVGAILPGLVGGDILKALFLCKGEATHARSQAMAVVLLDRAIGVFSLFLLATVALAISLAIGNGQLQSSLLLIAPAIALVSIIGAVLLGSNQIGAIRLLRTQWKGPLRYMQPVVLTVQTGLKNRSLLCRCVWISLVNHVLVCCSFIAAAGALGVLMPLTDQFVVNPLAMAMNLIPLTPGGIGLAETAFAYLYELHGSNAGAHVGLVGRAIQYAVLLVLGAPVFALLRIRTNRDGFEV